MLNGIEAVTQFIAQPNISLDSNTNQSLTVRRQMIPTTSYAVVVTRYRFMTKFVSICIIIIHCSGKYGQYLGISGLNIWSVCCFTKVNELNIPCSTAIWWPHYARSGLFCFYPGFHNTDILWISRINMENSHSWRWHICTLSISRANLVQ